MLSILPTVEAVEPEQVLQQKLNIIMKCVGYLCHSCLSGLLLFIAVLKKKGREEWCGGREEEKKRGRQIT